MEKIEGYVDHIIYRNQENGYTVMVLTSEDTEITCVGTFSYIGEGERLEAEGTYIAHPTYGSSSGSRRTRSVLRRMRNP